jgi:class 3 adenylate cyclase
LKEHFRIFLSVLLSLLASFSFASGSAPPGYDIPSKTLLITSALRDKTDISAYVETIIDSSGKSTLQDILKPGNRFIFSKNTDHYTSSPTNKVIWARIFVKNESSLNSEWKLIPHSSTAIGYCIYPTGDTVSQITGTDVPMDERVESALSPVLSFSLRKGEPVAIYMKITTGTKQNNTGKVSIDLSPGQLFEQNEKVDFSFQGMFGSVMLFTSIFAVLLWLFLRDRSMLYLACISFFALLYTWEASGMNRMVLFRNSSMYFLAFMSVINQAGGFLSGYFFYNSMLPLREEAPRLRKIFATLTYLQCLMALFRFITQNNLLPLDLLHFTGILWFVCMVTVVIYFLVKKNRQAKFLVVATVLLASCAILYGLALEHIVPAIFQRSFQVGMVVYVILLGVGAVDKVRQIRLERERLIREQNTMLEQKVEERTRELHSEKEKSDELLLNILPSETAHELKKHGKSKARSFEKATVLFTDFKNFTKVSETMSAEELVEMIHHIYSEFDNIIHKYGVEKIKTIGDSYMAAGGLPVVNDTNPQDVVNAAIEILHFIEHEKQLRMAANEPFLEIRIGINTGPLVAGIVGKKKFAYDIWGDTVNIASRMESSSEPGKINISGSTYEFIKDQFECTYRGKIHAKNKGEIDMYFVEGRK